MSENIEAKKKIEEFEKELQDLKKKYNLDPIATIEFPQYRVLPEELLLALKIIERHNYKIMLSYKEK